MRPHWRATWPSPPSTRCDTRLSAGSTMHCSGRRWSSKHQDAKTVRVRYPGPGCLSIGRLPNLYLKGSYARPRHRNDRSYAASTQLDSARHRGRDFAVDFAKAHEAAGFDMALVGYTTSSAEGFL